MNLPNALFFDIDGTLLDTKNHQVPDSTIKALNALTKQGYAICIASGRNLTMFQALHLENLVKWKYVILSNGHMILDENMNIIRHHLFKPETIKCLIQKASTLGIPVYLSGPEVAMFNVTPNENVLVAHDYYKEPLAPIQVYADEAIDNIGLYEKEGFDWSVFDELTDLNVKPTMTTSADVMKAGVSKHSSILDVLSMNGYSDYYIAFGDSMNDYEMLQHAPISIAMGNAIDPIKKIAHYIADAVDDDGIAKMLNTLGYLVD